MFDARRFWVLAYFRDFPMSGLVRTTSISECENSFFKRYTRAHSNLLEFWNSFTHALDAQRQSNAQMNYVDESAIPVLDTSMSIEKHAATVYTHTIYKRFQDELSDALFCCRILEMSVHGDTEEYRIEDEFDQVYNVVYQKDDDRCQCDCKMYIRMGLLCRHVLFVYKNKRVKNIPMKYICGRWKKAELVDVVHGTTSSEVEEYVGVQKDQIMKNKIIASVFGWLQSFEGKCDKLNLFLSGVNEVGESVAGNEPQLATLGKKKIFEQFYGSTVPKNIEVLPPNIVKTKGSGSRLVSRKEKVVKMMNKPLRKCAKCKKMVNHDSRNCSKVGQSSKKGNE